MRYTILTISVFLCIFLKIDIANAQPKGFGYAKTASSQTRTQNQASPSKTSSSSSHSSRSNTAYTPSSLSYKTWETKWEKGHTEFVRGSDGMVDETMYINCVCLAGTCKICAGLGVTGYGIFQTYCNYCGGSGKCSFCGGTGTKVVKTRYRYIDEYYSNGGVALHVTSSGNGPTVYQGGVGYLYNTYGNSQSIKDEGTYYSFGGETVYGIKTNSFRLSKDYKTLWNGNQEYHLVDKAEYDKIAEITSKLRNGVVPVTTGGSYSNSSTSSSSSRSRSSSSSVSAICKYCGGGGGCNSCKGLGHKYNSYSHREDTCPSCNGSGRCFNCRGTGRQR